MLDSARSVVFTFAGNIGLCQFRVTMMTRRAGGRRELLLRDVARTLRWRLLSRSLRDSRDPGCHSLPLGASSTSTAKGCVLCGIFGANGTGQHESLIGTVSITAEFLRRNLTHNFRLSIPHV
jgi:hypothetical protein